MSRLQTLRAKFSESQHPRDKSGRFAAKGISNLDGKETRKLTSHLGKEAQEAIKNNDHTKLSELVGHIDKLREHANKKENYYKYEADESEDPEYEEAWRFEKAHAALERHFDKVTNKLDELETRMEKKLQIVKEKAKKKK